MGERRGAGPKLWRLAAAAALLVAGLACGGGPSLEGTLRINLQTEPPTLDWTRATDGVSITVIEQLMRGLTRLGPDLRPLPPRSRSAGTCRRTGGPTPFTCGAA
jgi:ABC-type oligopeptide transport system substrate-binding subunit